mmetsp:Transcript_38791/g.74315  ORF Transcript_38791/g.74315 Transcript_38791/m.74315 type:complete len:719 (+) Transcript_38791:332-2488(+)
MSVEIFFCRNDIIQGGSTARGTMRVLPLGKSKTQKIISGDSSGVLQCFSYKKGELATTFKTLPTGVAVEAVELGTGQQQKDKVFVASGQTIRGTNKKGKDFFKFRSNLTEVIRNVRVFELQIWTSGDLGFNHFLDCKDKHHYMCGDKINDMLVTNVVASHEFNAVLACQDHHVRVLQGSELYYEASVDGPMRTLFHRVPKSGQAPKRKEIIFSSTTGQVGQMFLDSESVRRGWKFEGDGATKLASVEAMDASIDLTEDGTNDLVLGRDNGSLEVYAFDESNHAAPLKLLFKKALNESITTLGAGLITDAALEDVVVSTYSGKILAMSQASADGHTLGVAEEKMPADKMARTLARDIEVLQARMQKEREKYSKVSDDLIAVHSTFQVNDRFSLDPQDATYVLSIETPVPIFTVAVQSDVPVELLETESNVAILSTSPMDPENGNFCLATYRCQDSSNRIEIKMRVVEGHYGTVQAFIIPRLSPKTSQICSYHVRPLCLQRRVQKVDDKRPMSELRITGSFPLSEIHSWVVFCVPEIPNRAPGDDVYFAFESVLMGTILTCKYKAGEGVFRSDSLTTLAILKEGITKEATARKTRINTTFEMKEDSVAHFCRLMHPKLQYQLGLSKKVKLIEALKEVQMQEDDVNFLDPSYKEILDNAKQVEMEHKQQPRQLEYLHGIVKDLFIDFHKFKGSNVKNRLPQLENLLRNYDMDSLIHFISSA